MKSKGFTLLELLIVIAIVVILVGIAIAAINPARQMARSVEAARWAHVNTYVNAVAQNEIDHGGEWTCSGYPATTTWHEISEADYDICPCLYPRYIGGLPRDPAAGTPYATCKSGYDTDYQIRWTSVAAPYRVKVRTSVIGDSVEVGR